MSKDESKNVVYIKIDGLVSDEFKGEFKVCEHSENLLRVESLSDGTAQRKPFKIKRGENFYISKNDITKMH